ncbi:hypothetical protein [Croceicoccus sp. Ery15]|uniref:hypothetical protein n=1 Tax=Croceicoccus sp. Ery15 TaxID=1703338 RepID=UPI001E4CB764|nr:hypothetical protein [Croceicoccus sp. Ery15]
MNKFYDTLINSRGDILSGYRVQVLDGGGAVVDIYSDRSGTRFVDGAGNVVNYAIADDETGMCEFYWTAATSQSLQVLDPAGNLARTPISNFGDNFVLDNLSGTLPPASVDGLNDALDAKADQTEVDSLTTEVANKADAADLAALEIEVAGKADAADVANKADLVLGEVSGIGGNAPNVTQFPDHNFLNSGASASAVMAGTVDQPNVVGGKGYITTFTGDGTTDDFVVTPGFTVADVAYRNILVYLVTRATGAEVLQSEPTHYSVSGKGTGSITIAMNTPPAATEDLRVRVYRKENSAYSPLLNFSGFGYDNFNDGSGSMVIQFGAHHINIGNTGGHNTFGGGAGNTMRGGTSYAFATGLSHDLNNALGGFASGYRGRLNGSGAAHFGNGGTVGSFSAHFGELGDASAVYSVHYGRRGTTGIGGDVAQGVGAVNDPSAGRMGLHKYGLRRVLTSATTTTLIPVSGYSHFQMPENSKAYVKAEVLLSEVGTDNFRKINLIACVRRTTGSTMSFVANSTYADQATVEEENGVTAAGAEWQAQIYTSASGGFTFSARGKASLTIQALAKVEVLLIADDAAAV